MTVAAAWVLIALKVGKGSTVAATVATVGATVGAAVAVGLLHPTNKLARVNTTRDFHTICFILITIFLLTNIEGVFVAFCGIHDTAKTTKTPSLLLIPLVFGQQQHKDKAVAGSHWIIRSQKDFRQE
jgi:phosphate/sulfate permease